MSLSFSCHDDYYRYCIAYITASIDSPSPGHNSTLLNIAVDDAQSTDNTRV